MTEDASLDEFRDAGGDTETEGGDATASGADAAAASDGDDTPTASDGSVEPAATTYAWSPDGEACAECGTVASRRWEQDGSLVCPDCKDWDR
ncbi:DUF7573 domain-containing protein [Haloarcula litorea]|uniref:DUF7573 domain-containing protein n=1 Tax=Haloarcula litorea TaxID=3032579 RepID=UPI0023E88C7E|nr:hypothetical protein [Halomicroarcula sp. GDY20]